MLNDDIPDKNLDESHLKCSFGALELELPARGGPGVQPPTTPCGCGLAHRMAHRAVRRRR